MFSYDNKNYVIKHPEVLSLCKKVISSPTKPCLQAACTTETLRATFEFIKNHPVTINGSLASVQILMAAFLLKDQSSTDPTRDYTLTTASGVVKKVCETYVVLSYINISGDEINSTISYDDMVYISHQSISNFFPEYVKLINSFPPICFNPESNSFDLLIKLEKILSKQPPYRNISFVLDGVLSREIDPPTLGILRNLVVLSEYFVIPITSITALIQNAPC